MKMISELLVTIKTFLTKYALPVISVLFVLVIGLFLYNIFKPKEIVTIESQKEAETPQGVQQAAEKANINITLPQATEAAKEIHYIVENNTPPQYVIQTTGENVKNDAEKATKQNNADFSIVTDPKNPDKKYTFDELKEFKDISLNQYNIQAYKKVLHTISYSPRAVNDWSPGAVEYVHQWKVSKDGKYIGVGAEYNAEYHKTYMKITYTW